MIASYSFAPANVQSGDELIVYPNPVSSGTPFTLEGVKKDDQIQIYNHVGSLVKTAIATDSKTSFTLNLPFGMYVIRANNKAVQIFITE
jgi:hypothetical protein